MPLEESRKTHEKDNKIQDTYFSNFTARFLQSYNPTYKPVKNEACGWNSSGCG